MNALETYLVQQLRTAQKEMKSGEVVQVCQAIENYIELNPTHNLPTTVVEIVEEA